jgi:GNAT superfamily N-acetyltransferase
MGIATEMRGKGGGSWFMKQLIQEACDRGEREMVLEVIEQNTAAVHLYEKCGFDVIRRLIGLIRRDATEIQTNELKQIDIREVGHLIMQYGLPNLPWQLSGESIAQMNPPARAYQHGPAYAIISNPDVKDVVVWSLLVEPHARGKGLGPDMLKKVMENHTAKTWHIPALLPEELGKVYERAGFEREDLSQWQMKLVLG